MNIVKKRINGIKNEKRRKEGRKEGRKMECEMSDNYEVRERDRE